MKFGHHKDKPSVVAEYYSPRKGDEFNVIPLSIFLLKFKYHVKSNFIFI